MRAAAELAFYMEVFGALLVLVDTVIPRSVPDDVSLVRHFQKWLEFVREKGINLSFGVPVSEVDGVDLQEKGMEVPLEAVCAGASLA